MKQTILLVLILSLFLFPTFVFGEEQEEEKYQSMGLREACESEGISFPYPEYEEKEEKANIYLFRGAGCSHCYDFLTYLKTIAGEHGDLFNLISYEVWNDSTNEQLLTKVARKFGEKATGVPYIVIGKSTWGGYSESLNEEIFAAIQEEYENHNKNDVVTKVIHEKKTFGVADILIPGSFLLFLFLIFYARRKAKQEEIHLEA